MACSCFVRPRLSCARAALQDMPEAKGVQDVADGLGLTSIRDRVWYIQACSAQSGEGVTDGLDWLAEKLAAKA